VSGTAVEVPDDEEVDDDAPVAAQVLESEDDAVVLVVLVECLAVWVPAVAVVAAEPGASMAIAPPSPTRAATLAPAATCRARWAGCGRFRRGAGFGIARSFARGEIRSS
jgi:hypothetical protein